MIDKVRALNKKILIWKIMTKKSIINLYDLEVMDDEQTPTEPL